MEVLVLSAPLSIDLSLILNMATTCSTLNYYTKIERKDLINRQVDVFDQFSNVLVCENGYKVVLSIEDFLQRFPIDNTENEKMYLKLMLTYPEQAHLFV